MPIHLCFSRRLPSRHPSHPGVDAAGRLALTPQRRVNETWGLFVSGALGAPAPLRLVPAPAPHVAPTRAHWIGPGGHESSTAESGHGHNELSTGALRLRDERAPLASPAELGRVRELLSHPAIDPGGAVQSWYLSFRGVRSVARST